VHNPIMLARVSPACADALRGVLTDIQDGDCGDVLRGDERWRTVERPKGEMRTLKRSKGGSFAPR